jgi:peroxiredoxin (alkyl hydroperoxide reductase subunit C)
MSILIGRKAPDFNCAAVLATGEIVGNFNLATTIAGKYALVFFYPLDFTFVCPSELIALDKRMQEFKRRNIEVVAVSIDSQFTHNAWRNTAIKDGGIGPVNFTLAADVSHTICQAYNVEHPEAGVAFRAAFMINKEGIVKSQVVNDLPIGRNIDELIRTFDAIAFTEEHGEVCPAGWNSGDAGMKPSVAGVAEYLEEHAGSL